MDDQLATQLASAMTGTTPASAFHTDAAATTATFTVTEKFGLMTAHGTIPVVTADVTVDADGLPRGTATLDVSALDTGNARRDKDLRGARFFDTATFPLVDFRQRQYPPHRRRRRGRRAPHDPWRGLPAQPGGRR